MKTVIFKIILSVLLIMSLRQLQAQDYCTNCNIDSMYKQVAKKKTDSEKIKLLQKVFLSYQYSGAYGFSAEMLDSLIILNERTKTIDASPYIALRVAGAYRAAHKYEQSLAEFKKAIQGFDKEKRVIVQILMVVRTLYNNLDRQEERGDFFKEKLNYYLINGPTNNTAACYHALGGYYYYKGNYDQAISNYLRAAEVFKKFSYWEYVNDISVIGVDYALWGNFDKAEYYLNKSLLWYRKTHYVNISYPLMAMSNINLNRKDYTKALSYADESINSFTGKTLTRDYAVSVLQKGLIYLAQNQPVKAYPFLIKSKSVGDTVAFGAKLQTQTGNLEKDFAWFLYYNESANYPSAEKSLLAAYSKAVQEKSSPYEVKYLAELSKFYADKNRPGPAKIYLAKYFSLDAAMRAEQASAKIAHYENEQRDHAQAEKINNLRQERLIQAAVINKSRIISTISLIAILIISCASFFIYRQYQNNKKTLLSLRKTQRQLIQSEKMASLGELTAGIAHEIQNPLNFVNNFSDVNREMIDELKEELKKGDIEEAIAIANDIQQNEEKINHHGKRADFIVKGMLQHSRTSTGEKQETNINTLADEFFRLSYHGLRAKDKNFNAELVTNFDETLPKVNVAQQDMGRVLLNLFNNAFYAVNQKLKTEGEDYEPTVEVTTRYLLPLQGVGGLEIIVKDNGNGIPDAIKDKIMQPFFTTKPTGEGTGLGLSLSYDIVVKGHGGTITVNTKENEFTEFTVTLPIS